MLDEPPDAVEVVGAVPDLVRHAARAGPGARPGRARPRRPRVRGRRQPQRGRAEFEPPVRTSTAPAPAARASGSHSGSPRTDGAPWMDDRELLRRDRLARRAEDVRVLEPDVREHDDAGASSTFVASWRPPSPASTTAASTFASRERHERRRRQRLELRRRQRARPPAERAASAASRSASAPSTRIALGPRAHVRREVGADAEAGVAEELLDHPRRRRLAVRPDDVDRREARLRIAERGEQRPHPLEPETVLRPRREALQPGERGHAGRPRSRAARARAGSARASRARLDDVRRARSRRSARSRASPRPARSPCAGARARPRRRRCPCARSGRTTAAKIRRSSSLPSSTRRRCGGRPAAASWTRSSASCASACGLVGLGPRRHDQRAQSGREGATRSPRSRAASAGAGARAAARAPRAPSHGSPRRRRTGAA